MSKTGIVKVATDDKCIVEIEHDVIAELNMSPKDISESSSFICKNKLSVNEGDKVAYTSTKKNFDLWIKILYYFPLIGLIVGLLVSQVFEDNIIQFLFTISSFCLSLIIIAIIVVILKKQSREVFELTSIIEKAPVKEEIIPIKEEKTDIVLEQKDNNKEELDDNAPIEQNDIIEENKSGETINE